MSSYNDRANSATMRRKDVLRVVRALKGALREDGPGYLLRQAPRVPFVPGDLADRELLREIVQCEDSQVESLVNGLAYVRGLLTHLEACEDAALLESVAREASAAAPAVNLDVIGAVALNPRSLAFDLPGLYPLETRRALLQRLVGRLGKGGEAEDRRVCHAIDARFRFSPADARASLYLLRRRASAELRGENSPQPAYYHDFLAHLSASEDGPLLEQAFDLAVDYSRLEVLEAVGRNPAFAAANQALVVATLVESRVGCSARLLDYLRAIFPPGERPLQPGVVVQFLSSEYHMHRVYGGAHADHYSTLPDQAPGRLARHALEIEDSLALVLFSAASPRPWENVQPAPEEARRLQHAADFYSDPEFHPIAVALARDAMPANMRPRNN